MAVPVTHIDDDYLVTGTHQGSGNPTDVVPDDAVGLDDCGDTSTITDWEKDVDGLNPADNQVYVKEGSHSMALAIDASLHGAEYAAWINNHDWGDLSAYQHDWVYFWIYFTTLDYMRTPLYSISFRIGSAAGDCKGRIVFKNELAVGWNLIKLNLDNPDSDDGTIDWENIDYMRIGVMEVAGNTNDFTVYVDSIMFVASPTSIVIDRTKDFRICGLDADLSLVVKNTTDGSTGAITAVTEHTFTCTLAGGTNNIFANGDTYEILKTDTEDSVISRHYTDKLFGRKVTDPAELNEDGRFPEDEDLDEEEWSPGFPEKMRE